ncbi:hypothetical protein [Massilia sp. CF038]|uniref:hypothetical protein n=1 Tax=Massilia sp. CF038 TaxID=1881045 RepID=UPI000910375A|nr:hypothetical protein [Massilia sp. CF038]SHH69451.1 hypothetical protein SAMN05428948_4964 [Massilia sp. CF038]
MIAAILAFVIGLASALGYLLRRKWLDAVLAAVAAASLGALLLNLTLPGNAGGAVSISANDLAPAIGSADAVRVSGDGLPASQWQDLPARKLEWTAPDGGALALDFPRTLQLGRMFKLSVTMRQGAARKLQLLAENGQLVAENASSGTTLSVQWLPPVAEKLVFTARLLDAGGKTIAQGPVPFEVLAPVPLQVHGRFSAPSFDARALNQLLAQSNAVLDWQVTLGKVVTRSEAPRVALAQTDLFVVDASYLESLPDAARASLLVQVAEGRPLLILGASASEPAKWSRMFKLELREQPETKPAGSPLALASAAYQPQTKNAGGWVAAGDRIWTRPWEKGRITWLGVGEWHRYAIAEPRALAAWWQDVLDASGVQRTTDVNLIDPEEMPLPGQRLAICGQGLSGAVSFPALQQTLTWQRRPDRADAACVAVWPTVPGWLEFTWGGARPQSGRVYVYAKDDWPQWQKAQRREATLDYGARTPGKPARTPAPVPAWPFALLFGAAMLLLWWRERR